MRLLKQICVSCLALGLVFGVLSAAPEQAEAANVCTQTTYINTTVSSGSATFSSWTSPWPVMSATFNQDVYFATFTVTQTQSGSTLYQYLHNEYGYNQTARGWNVMAMAC